MGNAIRALRILAAALVLLCFAASAGAVTCTIDQRPSATLLIPYFQATFNPDGTILATGSNALDTLITVGNASPRPMVANVTVWSERSEAIMGFNIALTGFDVQSFSMASVLRGNLPATPVNISHVPEVKDTNQVVITGDVCQRNAGAPVYPSAGGYLRARPTQPATALDNTTATVSYPAGPFASAFLFRVLDSLDNTKDSNICGGVDGIITNPIRGYVTIDHVNYCTITNPSDPAYYTNDAIGMENNLFGDYIYTSGAGVGTMGFPAVAIEADASLEDSTAAPTSPASTTPGRRTFYRRYVTIADPPGCLNAFVAPQAAYSCGGGDQREPLGLKYAVRWLDSGPTVTSFLNVWRASAGSSSTNGGLADLLGFAVGKCNTTEPQVTFFFYDEDENVFVDGVCPGLCGPGNPNFRLETTRQSITFTHPNWPAGWLVVDFENMIGTAPIGGVLDQAYLTYDFQGPTAFLSAGVPAIPLDPSTCQPLRVPVAPAAGGVTPSAFAAPLIGGTGPVYP